MSEATVLSVGRLDNFDEDSAKRVDIDGHRLAVVRLAKGRIAASGGPELADELEDAGYGAYAEAG